jgi:alpha-glucuronidase
MAKEEMVDLKPKAEKITEEQLKDLQSVVNDNNAIQFRVGALEAQKHELLHQQASMQSKIIELQNTFSKEYGTFDVDLADGTINYPNNG